MIDRRCFSATALLAVGGLAADRAAALAGRRPKRTTGATPLPALLDDLEHRTFRWFWDTGNPANGLVPDSWPNPATSIAVDHGVLEQGRQGKHCVCC